MTEKITIVPAREEHIADCVRISIECYEIIHEAYSELLTPEIHDGAMGNWREIKKKSIEDQQRGPNAFVALLDGKVVGFAAYTIINGVGHILNNAVDNCYRGNGIAKLLYERLFEGMRADGALYARVHTGGDDGHAPARRAYEKMGFEKYLPSVDYIKKL
ncbi:MAG: GNAT family N-acetyltransferase [Ruminococcaceae bacterium]|nr:GNAT family N-acetyltransferase [Oscillospiraceae bacterium]